MWCDHLPVNTGTRLRTCASYTLFPKSSNSELILEHSSRSCLLKYFTLLWYYSSNVFCNLDGRMNLFHPFSHLFKINFGGRLKHCLYQCFIKNISIRCEINARLKAMVEINISNDSMNSCCLLQRSPVGKTFIVRYKHHINIWIGNAEWDLVMMLHWVLHIKLLIDLIYIFVTKLKPKNI